MLEVGSQDGSYFCSSLTSQLSTNADALSRVPKHLVNLVSGVDILGDQDQIRKLHDIIARTIQAIEQNTNLIPQQLAKQKKELVVKNGILCRCFKGATQ